MLRSLATFFQCKKNDDSLSDAIFPKKLLDEVNAEILYRQNFFFMCTFFMGFMTIGGTVSGFGVLFKYLKNNVDAHSDEIVDPNDLKACFNHYAPKAALYGLAPVGNLTSIVLECQYFYSELKKYYHYAENAALTDLSPELYERVTDYLMTVQYEPNHLTLADLQEILFQEAERNDTPEQKAMFF